MSAERQNAISPEVRPEKMLAYLLINVAKKKKKSNQNTSPPTFYNVK